MKFDFRKLTHKEIGGFVASVYTKTYTKYTYYYTVKAAYKCLIGEAPFTIEQFFDDDLEELIVDTELNKWIKALVYDFQVDLLTHLNLHKNGDTNNFVKTDENFTQFYTAIMSNDPNEIIGVLNRMYGNDDLEIEFEAEFDLDDTEFPEEDIEPVELDKWWVNTIDLLDFSELDDENEG